MPAPERVPDWATPLPSHVGNVPELEDDSPSITAHRVRVDDAIVAPVSADRWPLDALGGTGRKRSPSLRFDNARKKVRPLPEQFGPSLKRVAYLFINKPTPDSVLRHAHTVTVEWPSPQTISTLVDDTRAFMNWLDTRGVTAMHDCTPSLLDDYATDVLGEESSQAGKARRLHVLWRLSQMSDWLPLEDRLVEPSWRGDVPVSRLGEQHGSATSIIDPATMDALLIWAIAFVREFASDILTAHEVASTSRAAATRTRGVTPWLNRYLDANDGRLPYRVEGKRQLLAAQYLSSISGFDADALRHAAKQVASNRDWVPDITMPTSISPALATVADKPWADGIDYYDVMVTGAEALPTLLQHLQAAAFVLISYLTGARPQEVLALPKDCIETVPPQTPGGINGYVIHGKVWKGRSTHGDPSLAGDDSTWATIKPAADAVGVAAAIAAESEWLFPAKRNADLRVPTARMGDYVTRFVQYVNQLSLDRGLPEAYLIPDDPNGALTPKGFRRSLAWHIEGQKEGEIALALQYKHASTSLGRDGYASTATTGVRKMMSQAAAEAHTKTLREVGRALTQGVGVSGPAAERLVQAARLSLPLLASFTSGAEARKLASDPATQVFDNPDAYSLCVYVPRYAKCAGTAEQPDLGSCQLDCANHARTDQEVERLRRHEAEHRHEAQSPLTPEPLAVRLLSTADAERARIEEHERSRTVVWLPQPELHDGEEPE